MNKENQTTNVSTIDTNGSKLKDFSIKTKPTFKQPITFLNSSTLDLNLRIKDLEKNFWE